MQIFMAVLIFVVWGGGVYVLTLRREVKGWKQKANVEEKVAQEERQRAEQIRDFWSKADEGRKTQLEGLRGALKELQRARDEAIGTIAKQRQMFEQMIADLKATKTVEVSNGEERRKVLYQRIPRFADAARQTELDRRRMVTLATVPDEDPTWFALLSLIDEHEGNELEMGLKMGLNDGDRQYHAGRAASARDLAMAIRDVRAQGQMLVERKKAAA